METKENQVKVQPRIRPNRPSNNHGSWTLSGIQISPKKEEMKVNSLFLIIKAKITATALHRREETGTECYNCALIQHLGSNIISFSQESKD